MSRIYVIPWNGTVTNAGGNADLWEISPADDLPVRIRGIRLGQISEVGDSAAEGLHISVKRLRATVTSGSGGTTSTPEEVGLANQAPSFTAEHNNTTVATTTGDTEILDALGWVIQNSPFETWYPDREYAPKAIQTETLVVRMETTPADDFSFVGAIWVEEG